MPRNRSRRYHRNARRRSRKIPWGMLITVVAVGGGAYVLATGGASAISDAFSSWGSSIASLPGQALDYADQEATAAAEYVESGISGGVSAVESGVSSGVQSVENEASSLWSSFTGLF